MANDKMVEKKNLNHEYNISLNNILEYNNTHLSC